MTIVADITYKAREEGLSKVNKNLKDIDKNAKKSSKSVNDIGKYSKTAVVGILALGTATASFVKATIESADVIGKTADKIGISTDALQEYQHAAGLAGISNQTLEKSLQRLARQIDDVDKGQGGLKKTFDELGISVRDENNDLKSTETILSEVADALLIASAGQERLNIAVKAFGANGADMVNMLSKGADELAKVRQEARDLGIVLEEDLIRSAEATNDAFAKMTNSVISGLKEMALTTAMTINSFLGMGDTQSKIDVLQDKINDKIRKQNELLDDGIFFTDHRMKVAQSYIDIYKKERDELQKTRDSEIEYEKKISKLKEDNSKDVKTKEKVLSLEERSLKILTDRANVQREDNLMIQQAGSLFSQNIISMEEYLHLLQQAKVDNQFLNLEPVLEANVQALEIAKDELSFLENTAVDGVHRLSDAMVDSALSGEKSFGDMAKSILTDITSMIIKQQLFNALSGGKSDGSGGLIGSILSGFSGSSFDSSSAVLGGSLGTTPGSSQSTMLASQQFAKGGAFTNTIAHKPTKFKFADGVGIMGEKNSEAIMPLHRGSDGSLGVRTTGNSNDDPVTVNVINNSSNTTQSVTESNNGKSIDILIEDKIKNSIGNGSLDRQMRTNYGLRRNGQ